MIDSQTKKTGSEIRGCLTLLAALKYLVFAGGRQVAQTSREAQV